MYETCNDLSENGTLYYIIKIISHHPPEQYHLNSPYKYSYVSYSPSWERICFQKLELNPVKKKRCTFFFFSE